VSVNFLAVAFLTNAVRLMFCPGHQNVRTFFYLLAYNVLPNFLHSYPYQMQTQYAKVQQNPPSFTHPNIYPTQNSYLLSQGAQPTGRDRGQWSLLHHAAAGGQVACLFFLLTTPLLPEAPHFLEIDSVARDGSTPLLVAVMEGKAPEVVQLLLRAGADPTKPNEKGESAFSFLTSHMQKHARKVGVVMGSSSSSLSSQQQQQRQPLMRLNKTSRALCEMAGMVFGGGSVQRAVVLRLRWQGEGGGMMKVVEEEEEDEEEEEEEGGKEGGKEKGVVQMLVDGTSDDVFGELMRYLDTTSG
jgi:hypothetical protein